MNVYLLEYNYLSRKRLAHITELEKPIGLTGLQNIVHAYRKWIYIT
jgi:hypothetical protein